MDNFFIDRETFLFPNLPSMLALVCFIAMSLGMIQHDRIPFLNLNKNATQSYSPVGLNLK